MAISFFLFFFILQAERNVYTFLLLSPAASAPLERCVRVSELGGGSNWPV